MLQRGGPPVAAKALVWQGGRLIIASSGGQTAANTFVVRLNKPPAGMRLPKQRITPQPSRRVPCKP